MAWKEIRGARERESCRGGKDSGGRPWAPLVCEAARMPAEGHRGRLWTRCCQIFRFLQEKPKYPYFSGNPPDFKTLAKKNSSFRTALANICGSDQPMGGQFQVMAVCSSIFVFDLTSPFMFSFSSALGKWPRPTRSRAPSGCSNALHIEGT